MVFALINNLYLIKGYGPVRLMSEFHEKGWKGPDCTNSWRGCVEPEQLSASMKNVTKAVRNECAISLRLVWWQNVDILKTKCDDANCVI